jgi:arylsulfatase A-like enzyme
MNRRQFLKKFAATGAGGYLLSSNSVNVHHFADRYNVLFMAIDDLNDWVGCLGGHPDTKTPNMDRLAARGMNFASAHSAAPVCNPSRASLMTGILPSTSGVYGNTDPWREHMPDAVTLPQHFMAHGYKAIARGKIYHGGWPDTNPGAWDEYIPKGGDPAPDTSNPRYANPISNVFWGPVNGTEEEMDDYKVASWTADQLNTKHDKPFFLGCGFFKPHLKWCVPQEFFDMFPPEDVTLPNINENDLDDVPPLGDNIALNGVHEAVLAIDGWADGVAAYLATINFVDKQVGRVLDALEASEYNDNTIVVLWSDHGWHLGEKLHWKKFSLWEEATHNLLFMSVPGLTKPNSRCEQPVNLTDIYPTLVDLCGLRKNDALQGLSLVPLLMNPDADWQRPALSTRRWKNHSLRTKRWRYIQYSDGTEELYDRDVDPLEWTNLLWGTPLPEHRAIADDLIKWLPTVNNQ